MIRSGYFINSRFRWIKVVINNLFKQRESNQGFSESRFLEKYILVQIIIISNALSQGIECIEREVLPPLDGASQEINSGTVSHVFP